MASIVILDKMLEFYENNLEKYVKKHSGEHILIEYGSKFTEFTVTFYKTGEELQEYLIFFGSLDRPTTFITKIPKEIPEMHKLKTSFLN